MCIFCFFDVSTCSVHCPQSGYRQWSVRQAGAHSCMITWEHCVRKLAIVVLICCC